MKKHFPLLLFALLTTASGCSVIEGVFKTGFWAGIIMVVVVLAVIIWVINKFFGKRG